MRCECCNVVLTPQESVRKFKHSGNYTDTCTRCLREIDVDTLEGSCFIEEELEDEDTPFTGFDNDDLDEI